MLLFSNKQNVNKMIRQMLPGEPLGLIVHGLYRIPADTCLHWLVFYVCLTFCSIQNYLFLCFAFVFIYEQLVSFFTINLFATLVCFLGLFWYLFLSFFLCFSFYFVLFIINAVCVV